MAYSDTVEMVTGDTLPDLNFNLKDSSTAATGKSLDPFDSDTWAPLALTGAVVKLRIRPVGSTTLTATIDCEAIDLATGQVRARFINDAFQTAGTYEGELEISYPGDGAGTGTQTVVDLIKFKVREDFD